MRRNISEGRSNALGGRGGRTETRGNALWGRGGRTAGAALAVLCAALVTAASATAGKPTATTYVPDSLSSAIAQSPKQTFDVILQGDPKGNSHGLLTSLLANQSGATDDQMTAASVRTQYTSIDGLHATLTGRQILNLARRGILTSIVPNEPVQLSGTTMPAVNFQLWPWAVGAAFDWMSPAPGTPTIAVVDSGIDASRSDFGGRVVAQVNLASLTPNSPGDGYGHGTFVAGVAPNANLVSLDVMNDEGEATVADVINACDWILANRGVYDIRVANFSLHAVSPASILFDPLDRAVEKLWLSGVVVVAAAGNYGISGQPSGVEFAPGNDPFVITVGATDIGTRLGPGDDTVAPWSAWGYTPDGFAKPDLGAPGRYMIGPVPDNATLESSRPGSVSSPGYMQLSGTSFAAPVVAGAAAELLGQHPGWTPDQVKGVLMLTAAQQPLVPAGALGVGEVNIAAARFANPSVLPNPNAGLGRYVTTADDGSPVFDSAAWQSAALSNAAWGSAAWSSAAWSSAAWSSAAWSSAAWSSAAWSSAAWGSVAWSDAAWSSAAWSDAAVADGAGSDPAVGSDATAISSTDQTNAEASLGIDDSSTTTSTTP
jgi:serine protease AprX